MVKHQPSSENLIKEESCYRPRSTAIAYQTTQDRRWPAGFIEKITSVNQRHVSPVSTNKAPADAPYPPPRHSLSSSADKLKRIEQDDFPNTYWIAILNLVLKRFQNGFSFSPERTF